MNANERETSAARFRQQCLRDAETAIAAGAWSRAADVWSRFRDAFPEEAAGYVGGAFALRVCGQSHEACEIALAGLARVPDDPDLRCELAWSLWGAGNIAAAADAAESLRARFPDRADGFNLGLMALSALGRFDEAERLGRRARRLFANDEEILTQCALIPGGRGDWRASAARLGALHKRFSGNPSIARSAVAAQREAGRLKAAAATADRALQQFPDDVDLLLERAWVEGARGDWPAMVERCETLRRRFPDDQGVLRTTVMALRASGDLVAAARLVASGLERFPDDEGLLIESAEVHLVGENWERADAQLREIRSRFPHLATGWAQGSLALRQMRRHGEALAIAEEGCARFPNDLELRAEEARALRAAGEHERALARLDVLRADFPDSADVPELQSATLREAGRFDEAAALIEAAVRQFPDDFGLAYERALIAVDRQDTGEAAQRLREVRERFPDRPEPVALEASALRDLGRLEEAEAAIAAGRARFPADPSLVAEAALVQADRKSWAGAVEIAATLRAIAPGDKRGYVIATFALLELRRYAEAEALINEGFERFPDDRDVGAQRAHAATNRADWPEALRRWSALVEKFPDDRECVSSLLYVRAAAQHTEIEPAPATARISGADIDRHRWTLPAGKLSQEEIENDRRRLADFESLGENCEFGSLQSRFQLEPLGLLRWGSIYPRQLVAMLDARLEGVGLAENTFVDDLERREYLAGDRRYFSMHTFIPCATASREQVHRQICRRLRFLKDKFIEDLSEAHKIFVYKSHGEALSDEAARAIWKSLQAYGANRLLCVRPTESASRSGRIEAVGERLYHGYIKGLGNGVEDADERVDDWLSLCRTVHALAFG